MSDIVPGDVVRLRGSTDVSMTVELVYEATYADPSAPTEQTIKSTVAKLVWFTPGNQLVSAIVSLSALEKVNG